MYSNRSSVLFHCMAAVVLVCLSNAYVPQKTQVTFENQLKQTIEKTSSSDRRGFLSKAASISFGIVSASKLTPQNGGQAEAVGPVKVNLLDPIYSARICPKDKPIPGEKAMKGMRGLCVTVKATLEEKSPKVRVD